MLGGLRDTKLNVILSIDIRIMYLPPMRLLAMLGGLLRYTIKCYTEYVLTSYKIISNVRWIVVNRQLNVILSIDIRIMYLPAIKLLAMLGGLL